MTKTFYAIIPARQGSKGVPNKNVKNLGGHPLIAYSIAAAKLSPEISRVIMTTDSEEYADIAKKYGAEAPFIRPADISQDRSTDLDFFQHCIRWFRIHENQCPDFWVHLRPTTPLRDPHHISQAIKDFLSSPEPSSLRSGHVSSESPFKWFKKNHAGFFTSLSDDTNIDSANRPRQEFPDVYVPDGYVDIVRTDLVEKQNMIHGNRVLGYESPDCTEIDSQEEFDYLEYTIQKNGSPLKQYLDKIT